MLTETIILLMLNAVSSISMPSPAPHIIIIIADDLGWNDVSFHGSNEIPTPNIDALAYNGIILNNHYVPAICTPSRAALLTGKYPIHTGMQHSVLFEPEPRGLPLTEKLLSQYLQQAGYKTHAVGKWHLGFYKQVYTPTFRGFDSHFGYWNGLQDYYNHDVVSFIEGYRGFDMRRNMTVAIDTRNKYSTDLFTDEAVNLINQHNINESLFLYMAHLAVHSGNEDKPFQAPDEEIVKFSHIEDPERRTYAAMVKKLDDSVGEVVAALQHRDMLKNSIILFMADNGAPTMGLHYNSGSNYPLRGIKDSAWEGGIRSVAAIWSPLIKNSKRVSNQLMHVTDWLPTFLSAAGISSDQLGPIDGINFWPALNNRRKNPRTEILINIDNIVGYSAIRSGDLKYINGSTETGDSWYGSSGELTDPNASVNYSSRNILECKVSRAINNLIMKIKNSSDENMHFQAKENKTLDCIHVLTASKIRKLRDKATIRCNKTKSEEIKCNPLQAPCLFNIKNDPCEMINLASSMPQKVKELKEKLQEFQSNIIPPSNVPNDKNGNPALWNGIWVSWQDPNPAGL